MFKTFQLMGYMGGVPTRAVNTTSAVLSTETFHIMIDAGENSYRNFLKHNYKLSRLKYIFITHLHPDHIGGLIPLLFYKRVIRNNTPLVLVGHTDGAFLLCEMVSRSNARIYQGAYVPPRELLFIRGHHQSVDVASVNGHDRRSSQASKSE